MHICHHPTLSTMLILPLSRHCKQKHPQKKEERRRHGMDRALVCVPFVQNVLLLRLVRPMPLVSDKVASLYTLSVFSNKVD